MSEQKPNSQGWNTIDDEMCERAWALRKRGIYTMREIAEQLGVLRLSLIEALEQWLDRQEAKDIK